MVATWNIKGVWAGGIPNRKFGLTCIQRHRIAHGRLEVLVRSKAPPCCAPQSSRPVDDSNR